MPGKSGNFWQSPVSILYRPYQTLIGDTLLITLSIAIIQSTFTAYVTLQCIDIHTAIHTAIYIYVYIYIAIYILLYTAIYIAIDPALIYIYC